MKKILFLIIILGLAALSCRAGEIVWANSIRGSGNVVEETRPVSGVTSVELATSGKLYIEMGDREELRIEAENNLLPYIQSEVQNGHLIIDIQDGARINKTEPINYYLMVQNLQAITLSSSGDVQAPEIEASDFVIVIQSSGDLRIDGLSVDRLRVNISSSGDMSLGELLADDLVANLTSSGNLDISSGAVDSQSININSSGDYDTQNVESKLVEAEILSSGNAHVRVSDILTAFLSSSGDLYYIGDPELQVRTSSSGKVIQNSK